MRLRFLSFLLLLLAPLSAFAQASDWFGDKYSMFIHYGLYSLFGGVFDGEPVREGYSEQILTFGVHFSDWYEAATRDFVAGSFDADSIVALAKKAGMRSIVLTAKHHDGFCLFKTATTKYNSFDGTPAHRDLVAEMAEACHRAGLGFGVYFSLIDWHYPYAVPFTSHNADPVTSAHHEYNKAQVTELLSNYGTIDEIWFDMGSLTEHQSAELYALVHSLQPQCMVSGRLGNDYADFAVMPDNALPDYAMDMPWQTAASIFPETWGYRSWQDHSTSAETKAAEKLRDLIHVVTGGGKYLLNIGPMGSGAVVPYEREVLERMGAFLDPVKEAVYGTRPARFVPNATLSSDGESLYLFVEKGTSSVSLPRLSSSPLSARTVKGGLEVPFEVATCGSIALTSIPDEGLYTVVCLRFPSPVTEDFTARILKDSVLDARNAEPLYTHSSADYYASFRAVSGYRWVTKPREKATLHYTEAEAGHTVSLNGARLTLPTSNPSFYRPDLSKVTAKGMWEKGTARGLFGDFAPEKVQFGKTDCAWTNEVRDTLDVHRGMMHRLTLTADEAMNLPVRFDFSDGLLVALNGTPVDAALQREGDGTLTLLLPLRKGDNLVEVKTYNLTAGAETFFRMMPLSEIATYEMTLDFDPVPREMQALLVEIKRPHALPFAAPAHLSGISLTF